MKPTLPLITALLLAPLAALHAADTPKPVTKPNVVFSLEHFNYLKCSNPSIRAIPDS